MHPQPVCKKNAHGSHHGRTGITRHSRTRMVLTAYGALSLATNSSCHHHRRISGLAEPGWAHKTSADLTPATGARTTRLLPSASLAFTRVLRRIVHPHRSFCETGKQRRSSCARSIAHGISALQSHHAPDAAASTASHPNVRDDRQRPSLRYETAGLSSADLGVAKTGIFFGGRVDRWQLDRFG